MPNSPESSGSPLHFIAPHVIDRLVKGSFVAKRKPNKAYQIQNERRSLISPLNVTRRAIKYEPLVFDNRTEQVLASSRALNDPVKKVLMVSGNAGMGKTSFLRAMAEMMGGGQEQLIWFDVSRHTDVDELVRYLVDSMVYVLSAPDKASAPAKETLLSSNTGAPGDGLNISEDPAGSGKSNEAAGSTGKQHPLNAMPDPTTLSPIDHLDALLKQWPDVPFLIAIDNVEHLVGPDQMLKSRELKDALNFLLAFSNIKLMMAGSQLPYNDLSPTAKYAHSVVLRPLSQTESLAVLWESINDELTAIWQQQMNDFPEPLAANVHWPLNYWPMHELVTLCHGEPWLIKLLGFSMSQFPNPAFWQEFVQEVALQPEHDTAGYLFAFFQTHLTAHDRQVMDLLAMLRHSLTLAGINTLLSMWSSAWGDNESYRVSPKEFQQSWLFPLLKKQYPPQMVLNQLRQRLSHHQVASEHDHIEAYYELNEHWVALALETFQEPEREMLMGRLHEYLAGFYMDEKAKPLHERIYPARIRHLVAEAQYHATRAKRLNRTPISQNQAIALAASTAMPVQSYAATEPHATADLLPNTVAKAAETDILSSSLSDMVKRHYPIPFPEHDGEQDYQSELLSMHHDYDDAPAPAPNPVVAFEGDPIDTRRWLSHLDKLSADASAPERSQWIEPLSHQLSSGRITTTHALLDNMMDWAYWLMTPINAFQGKLSPALPRVEHLISLLSSELSDATVMDKPLQYKMDALRITYYRYTGNWSQAKPLLDALLKMASTNPEQLSGISLSQLYEDKAEHCMATYHTQDAVTYLKRAIQALEEYPTQPHHKALLFFSLAEQLEICEQPHKARQAYKQCLKLSQQHEQWLPSAECAFRLGESYMQGNQLEKALRYLTLCWRYEQRLSQQGSDSASMVKTAMQLSQLEEKLSHLSEALHWANQALNVARRLNQASVVAVACLRLAQLSEKQGGYKQAWTMFKQAASMGQGHWDRAMQSWLEEKCSVLEPYSR